jgi:hypothetical protein
MAGLKATALSQGLGIVFSSKEISSEKAGRGMCYHTVSSRDAHDSQDAIKWAKLELGQTGLAPTGLGTNRRPRNRLAAFGFPLPSRKLFLE